MRVWHAAFLVNLALVLGVGLGYAAWGRRAEALGRDVEAVHAQLERLERERQACASGGRAGEQQWEGRGVVRAVYAQMVVITHEEIRGLLPARTTSFPASMPRPAAPLRIGEPIRFSLRGTVADDAAVVAIERW
jgi:Copper binding periplasmic protein CusF